MHKQGISLGQSCIHKTFLILKAVYESNRKIRRVNEGQQASVTVSGFICFSKKRGEIPGQNRHA
jgi:hypothetical protein